MDNFMHMAVHRDYLARQVRIKTIRFDELAPSCPSEEKFFERLAKGPEWYPLGECDNFDAVKGECRGHHKGPKPGEPVRTSKRVERSDFHPRCDAIEAELDALLSPEELARIEAAEAKARCPVGHHLDGDEIETGRCLNCEFLTKEGIYRG